MKKLIKSDLCDILRLVPVYLPVNADSVGSCIDELRRCQHRDYLFMARREKIFLFDLPAVYVPDSYENLSWRYMPPNTAIFTRAMLLHISQVTADRPIGTVTLLHYPSTLRDVELFSNLPVLDRAQHIEGIIKSCTRKTQYCTILDVIRFLRTGRS